MIIADHHIDLSTRPFTIAEAGINHNGDLDTALAMISAAKDAGADAVSFRLSGQRILISAAMRPTPIPPRGGRLPNRCLRCSGAVSSAPTAGESFAENVIARG